MVRPWLYSVAGVIGFFAGSWLLFTYALPLVIPFVVAMIMAELMDPLISRLTWKGKVPRGISVAFVLMLFVGLVTLGVTLAIARLVSEVQGVIADLPNLYGIAMGLADRFAEQFGAFNATLPETVQTMLADNLKQLLDSLSSWLPKASGALGAVSSVPAFVTNTLIALIATFFIARDRRDIGDGILSLFPKVWRPKLQRVKNDVWTSTIGWAKAQFLLILMTMLQTMVGLSFLGVEYAVTMGVVVGLADVMPILGPAAIYLPWALYSFVFGSKVFAVKLLVLYAVVGGVRQVLEAKIVGDKVGLHPLAILFSLYMGFQFFGALGVVFGPLLAILLKSMYTSGLLPTFDDDPPA